MQIVLFPYVYVEGVSVPIPAVDALVLPELPLLDDDFPNRFLLGLLLLLCGDQHNSYGGINIANISLTGATKKSALWNHIYSVKEMIAVELEEAQEREREAQERERLLKEKLEEREREAQEREREAQERGREAQEREREAQERGREAQERGREAQERERLLKEKLEERGRELEERERELEEALAHQPKVKRMKQ